MFKNITKKQIIIAILIVCLAAVSFFTLAFFTDRISHKTNFTTATFSADGYSLTRVAPDDPFAAGEDVEVTIKESNTDDTDIRSVITMTTIWTSPDDSLSIFGNDNADDNATISIDGKSVSYKVNDDGTATFALPEHVLKSGAEDQARDLVLHIPESFKSTGKISFTFDKVFLNQHPYGFTKEFLHDDLNKKETLDFDVRVGWAASNMSNTSSTPNGHKALMGYLTEKDANDMYGIEFKFEFEYDKSAMKDFTSKTDAKWSYYKGTVNSLKFVEGMTTIGDYAFPDFEKITSVTLPESITAVGTWAFDNTSLKKLTLPAKVANLETMSFGHINELTEITFNGSTGKDITLPEKAGKTTGAFYVYPYVETTINGTNEDALAYDWIKDLRKPPTLAASNSWLNTEHISYFGSPGNPVETVKFVTEYTPTGNETDSWNAAEDRDGDGENDDDIICYLDGTVLYFYANTATKIYANEDSSYVFYYFGRTKAFDNIEMLDTSKATNMNSMFAYCMGVTDLEVGHFDMSDVTDISSMFYLNYNIPELDVSKWDTGKVERMVGVFADCKALSTPNGIQNWDTQNVTTTSGMFDGASAMTSLDLSSKEVTLNGRTYDSWDTGKVESMQAMFGNTDGSPHLLEELNISTFDTRNVKTMKLMFEECYSLKELDVTPRKITLNNKTFYTWDTGKVQTMYGTFTSCTSLTSLDLSAWDTSSIGTVQDGTIEDFFETFIGCTALETLDVSRKEMKDFNGRDYTSWDTSNAVYMTSMFEECSSLKSLNLKNWNNASTEKMDNMFYKCAALEEINLTNFETPSLTYTASMFNGCSSLTDVDVSSFDTAEVYSFVSMFRNCTALESLDISNFTTESVQYANNMRWFAHNCPNLTDITLGENFGHSGKIPSAGSSNGMFYAGSAYSTSNPLRTKVTGANSVMQSYAWLTDCRGYSITVGSATGGTLEANASFSINEKTIKLTATPSSSYEYKGATMSYTDEDGEEQTIKLAPDTLEFTMPTADIEIVPKFKIPTTPTLAPASYLWSNFDSPALGAVKTVSLVSSYTPTSSDVKIEAPLAIDEDGEYTYDITGYWNSSTNKITLAGNGFPTIKLKDGSNLFKATLSSGGTFNNLTAISGLNILDTSECTTMNSMFYNCNKLTSINVSGFVTTKVTDMDYMFYNCAKITTLDLTNFNTMNCTKKSVGTENNKYLYSFAEKCDSLYIIYIGRYFGGYGDISYSAFIVSSQSIYNGNSITHIYYSPGDSIFGGYTEEKRVKALPNANRWFQYIGGLTLNVSSTGAIDGFVESE